MTELDAARTRFLTAEGWTGAQIVPLAGDASMRSYARVMCGHRRAVLMHAPAERGEGLGPFLLVARHLESLGLHPPAILAEDTDSGFLLLEDLGDRLFAREFQADPGRQHDYYLEALRILQPLHAAPSPPLPGYGVDEMATAASLAATWYADKNGEAAALEKKMHEALAGLDWSRKVPVLRDYHAENLIWCPQEEGVRRVGLLDFQDAGLGHPVYDAASLLQDARRDIDPALVADLISKTWSWFSTDRAAFDQAYHVLCAQRALRILGVFARLSVHFNKPAYVDLIPRVWGQLHGNLGHPALAKLSSFVANTLPPPDEAHLNDLKARAGTCPTL